jgi:hypothetical protein
VTAQTLVRPGGIGEPREPREPTYRRDLLLLGRVLLHWLALLRDQWLGFEIGVETDVLAACGIQQTAPRADIRASPKQRTSFALGHAAPDTELNPIV